MKEMILSGPAEMKMSSLEIADLLESRHDSVKRTVERLVKSDVIAYPPLVENPINVSGGRPGTCYMLDKRSSLIVVAQLSPAFTGRIVDRWQELEAQAKNVPALPATYVEALRALANEVEIKEIALTQRDEAIRTKAEIGSKREATAMATASVATKKVRKLEAELDKSKQYATVKRIEILNPGEKFPWKPLKDYSKLHGIPMVKVFDQNYGEVNSYHADVWFNVYGIEIQYE